MPNRKHKREEKNISKYEQKNWKKSKQSIALARSHQRQGKHLFVHHIQPPYEIVNFVFFFSCIHIVTTWSCHCSHFYRICIGFNYNFGVLCALEFDHPKWTVFYSVHSIWRFGNQKSSRWYAIYCGFKWWACLLPSKESNLEKVHKRRK